MATEAAGLAGFLQDLTLVSSGAAALTYGLWMLFGRKTLLHLGRLSLVAAFGASVLQLVALAPAGPSPASFWAFLLLAQFLLVEFVFHVSVLGWFVGLAGVWLAGWSYWPIAAAELAPAGPVVRYWWVLRDLAVGLAGTATALGLVAGLLLHVLRDRRLGGLVHTNDVQDMAATWALAPAPLLIFALAAGAIGFWRLESFAIGEAVRLGLLAHWLLASLAWLVVAQARRFRTRGTLLVMAWAALAFALYAGSFWRGAGLTSFAFIP